MVGHEPAGGRVEFSITKRKLTSFPTTLSYASLTLSIGITSTFG